MADSTNIESKVISTIADQLGLEESAIKTNMSISEDLSADSLDIVELVMQLEEGFGLDIEDEDAEKLQTVQDIIDYINEHG